MNNRACKAMPGFPSVLFHVPMPALQTPEFPVDVFPGEGIGVEARLLGLGGPEEYRDCRSPEHEHSDCLREDAGELLVEKRVEAKTASTVRKDGIKGMLGEYIG